MDEQQCVPFETRKNKNSNTLSHEMRLCENQMKERSWKKLKYNDKGGGGGFEKAFKLIFWIIIIVKYKIYINCFE